MTAFTTQELTHRNDEEFVALTELVDRVRADGRVDEAFAGETRERSIRDVLAHLLAWHLLFERWYDEGMRGGSPAMPAEGYSWGELDALNVALRDEWSATPLTDVEERLDASHLRLQAVLATHSDDQLANAGAFSWTLGSQLGEFFLENGGNHYRWGRAAIAEGLGLDL